MAIFSKSLSLIEWLNWLEIFMVALYTQELTNMDHSIKYLKPITPCMTSQWGRGQFEVNKENE